MKSPLFGVVFLWAGLASAQELFPLQKVPSSGACTITASSFNTGAPSPTPCPLGYPAPAGYHWDLAFDDEFCNDTQTDLNKWYQALYNTEDVGDGDPHWTYGTANCLTITPPFGDPASVVERSSLNSNYNPVFGYWEFSMKMPDQSDGDNYSGIHTDIFFHNYPRPDGLFELNLAEMEMQPGWRQIQQVGISCVDPVNESNFYSGINLDQSFNIYGFAWMPTPYNAAAGQYGTFEALFNGANMLPSVTPCINTRWVLHPPSPPNDGWYVALMIDGCNYPPGSVQGLCTSATVPLSIYYQYAREWNLVPN